MALIIDPMLAVDPVGNTSDPLKPATPVEYIPDSSSTDVDTDQVVPGSKEESEYKIEQQGKKNILIMPSIIVQGELGKIITKELNDEFSIEKDELPDLDEIKIVTNNDIDTTPKEDNKYKENYDSIAKESYIYATDMKTINTDTSNRVLDDLGIALEKYSNVYCYINPNDTITNKIGILEDFMAKNNIKIAHRVSSLISAIKEDFYV